MWYNNVTGTTTLILDIGGTAMKETTTSLNVGWNWDHSYARLSDKLYHLQQPTAVQAPQLGVLNEPLAAQLGLQAEALASEQGIAVLSGNKLAEGSEPLAQAYAGHQFGHFTMLGDGRALLLGEHLTPNGERVDIQLKGSGRTPYSRGGDGRAALGPMLREYIISEALHGLGIPTTRSLAVVETGENVQREKAQPGAVLTRVAASHLRVGTFQYAANWGGADVLQQLVEYAIKRHYSEHAEADNQALALLRAVIHNQAKLIASWQHVGFIHGVMNTDNMTISGESIDFGPCAFMNKYDPATVFSSIDTGGRYAYGNQPQIAAWNLARFAEALLPVIDPDSSRAVELAQQEISQFSALYKHHWLAGMRAKLGLANEAAEDEALIFELLEMMQEAGADYTNTFRGLTLQDESLAVQQHHNWTAWQERWLKRRAEQQATEEEAVQLMRRSNPSIIPRNHQVEKVLALAVEQGDYEPLEQFVEALRQPYAYASEQLAYVDPPDEKTDCGYVTYCGT